MARTVLGAITVRGCPEEVATARRFVAKMLAGHPLADTAVLLTSEAVTNAVVHTASESITVVVVETGTRLRFEICDEGADTVPAVHDPDGLCEDKRGMFLIKELSARHGSYTGNGGLTCWFEL